MEDGKKIACVTREEFMGEIGLAWMFISLSFVAMTLDFSQGFLTALWAVSFLMAVVYIGYSRVLNRRRRLAKRADSKPR